MKRLRADFKKEKRRFHDFTKGSTNVPWEKQPQVILEGTSNREEAN